MCALALLGTSCSSPDEIEVGDNSINKINCVSQANRKLSESDALKIANKFLSKYNGTRYDNADSASLDYVINSNLVEISENYKDTIAYVINYKDDGGFVVLAADGRKQPILAFSETGRFDKENEICKANFLDKLPCFLSERRYLNRSPSIGAGDLESGEIVKPFIQIKLYLGLPWTKYILENGIYVEEVIGNFVITAFLAVSHAKSNITYHGKTYPLSSIISSIKNGKPRNKTGNDIEEKIAENIGKHVSPPVFPQDSVVSDPIYRMPYETAVDYAAEMMNLIVDDCYDELGMVGYKQYGRAVANFLVKHGYQVPSGSAQYDIVRIAQYLKSDHIICLIASKNDVWYFWVADGLKKIMITDNDNDSENYFIHCEWGNNGICNGYYSGSVFSTVEGDLTVKEYIAVKLENKNMYIY